MSGIAGTWRKHSEAHRDEILSMIQALVHRGPDSQGTWIENHTALGACLLHTTPESIHEKAVLEDASGRYLMVWDGRLDNRTELQAKLGSSLSLEAPDPNFVLEAYRAWGIQSFAKLLGDFAFAILDRKENSLVCVRDKMGLKPLHYLWDHQTFAFASEAKGLFPCLKQPPQPDEEMLLAFLSFRNFKDEHHQHSFYAGIRRLPPAHYLLLQNGTLKVERYWSFDLKRQLRYKNSEEYAAAFREIFQEAVRCRMRSKNTATALLSGGLDSSAIVAAAGPSGLQALNFYSDDPKTDERHYATEAAKKAGIPLHMLFCRTNDFETGMDEFLAQVEAPIINTSRNLEPYQFLKDREWRVVLSGDGGDQVMDEFGFGADLLAHFRFPDFFNNTRLFAKDFDDRPIDVMKQSLMRLIPESWLWVFRRLRGNVPPPWVNQTTVEELGFSERLRQCDTRPKFQSFSQAANYDEAVRPYAVMKLEIEERAHAQFGLEPRYPYLDARVVEFILAMPWQERSSGLRKKLVRDAFQGLMPASIVNRHDKANHTRETDRALEALCRREAAEPLQNRSGRMKRYADFRNVRSLVDRYLAGQRDLRFEVWFLITLDHWLSNLKKGDFHVRKEALQEAKV